MTEKFSFEELSAEAQAKAVADYIDVLCFVYEMPNYQVKRMFWCSHCKNAQPFKGSCSVCKANHSISRKTIEIKDWEKIIPYRD